MRLLFLVVWLLGVPLGLALVAVWLLTPSRFDAEVSWLRSFVGDQQVPAVILLFTVFAMVLWRFRYALPLAGAAGIIARSDIPGRLRAPFDRAAQLLEDARRILRVRKRELGRAIRSAERERLVAALDRLEDAMTTVPLVEQSFEQAFGEAEELVGQHLSRWRKGELREYAESIGLAVAIALLLRIFAIEAFKIPSGSMIPSLMVGDHIFVAKYAYGPLVPWTDHRLYARLPPARADVMVFKFPENEEQDFIKRAVALPGDRLEALDGRPVLNGWLAPHCLVGRIDRGPSMQGDLYVEFMGETAYLTMYENRPGCPRPGTTPCESDADCELGRVCRGNVCGTLEGPYAVAPDQVWVMGDNRCNSHDSRSWAGGRGGGVPYRNIKGRAMFVWMSWKEGGGVRWDRMFASVMGRPRLPPSAPRELDEALERCLRNRPPLARTTPPER